MLGVTSPGMVAAVSNEGGLGSLPIGGLSPDAARTLIKATKQLTRKPFAVNLFAHEISSVPRDILQKMWSFLVEFAKSKGYQLDSPSLPEFKFYNHRHQVDMLLEEDIKHVSFTFGNLDNESIKKLHAAGVSLMGTATCLQEAQILESSGIDFIIAQGIEAGGHRGSFLDGELPRIGLFSLLSNILQKCKIPVIAAGGIHHSQSIRAAMELGASGVQIGTPFINSVESQAIPSYKKRLEEATGTDTKLTCAFSGRWARGIINEFMQEVELSGLDIPPYPYQNTLTASLRKMAQAKDDHTMTNLWSGQSLPLQETRSCKDIFLRLLY